MPIAVIGFFQKPRAHAYFDELIPPPPETDKCLLINDSLINIFIQVGKQFKKNKEKTSPKRENSQSDNDVTPSPSRTTSTSSEKVEDLSTGTRKLSVDDQKVEAAASSNAEVAANTDPAPEKDANTPSSKEGDTSPAEGATTPPSDVVPPPSPSKYKNPDIDLEWSVSCEQIIASVLTEPALCEFFEQKHSITDAIANIRLNRKKF